MSTKIGASGRAEPCSAVVQHEGRDGQHRGDDTQAHGIPVVGFVAGDLREQHGRRGERADAADIVVDLSGYGEGTDVDVGHICPLGIRRGQRRVRRPRHRGHR
ncbi:MAG: hypothetical protein JWP55_2732, partial [Mycobacterium sp.]|nr:hypothetical protein [Mycobacterium sp.]